MTTPLGSPAERVNKCDCCCIEPEGECCLSDVYTQVLFEMSGVVNQAFLDGVCECVNIAYVFDLDAEYVEFVVPCDVTRPPGFPYDLVIVAQFWRPFGCSQVIKEGEFGEPTEFNSIPGVFNLGWDNLNAYDMLVTIRRPPYTISDTIAFVGGSIQAQSPPRQVCFHQSRPVITCLEHLALISPSATDPQLQQSFQTARCNSFDGTLTLTLQ